MPAIRYSHPPSVLTLDALQIAGSNAVAPVDAGFVASERASLLPHALTEIIRDTEINLVVAGVRSADRLNVGFGQVSQPVRALIDHQHIDTARPEGLDVVALLRTRVQRSEE